MSLSCAPRDQSMSGSIWAIQIPTGTFFCDKTTAQSLPRRPTDMMFAAVIALKAYSMLEMSARLARAE